MTTIDGAPGESTQPRRVLLVDDSVDAAEAMSMLLETLGHEVRVMHDGPSALAMVDDFAPEVVILDIGLPGIDGFEVAREMRTRTVTKSALLIALTGYGADSDKQQVLVTTASLFDKWLKAHERFWPETPLPADMAEALKRDDFYTQALTNGAAVVTYAEIKVAKPAWATLAFAVLDARTQDTSPPVPDEMIITVRRADRVFVITAKTAVAAGPIAACDTIQAKLTAEAQAAGDADQAADGKDAALHEKAEQLARKADRAIPDCFATEARKAAFFPALVKQAQALIEMLPKK